MFKRIVVIGLLALCIPDSGCFYPPTTQPPAESKTAVVIGVPYDLTWEAAKSVIASNNYRLEVEDPDHGVLEGEAHKFTLGDADCGKVRSMGSPYDAEPESGMTAVYSLKVEPAGRQASKVSVGVTYSSPLHVPFHPVMDFRCVSRGTAESRLLNEIVAEARGERRPESHAPLTAPVEQEPEVELQAPKPSRPSLLGGGLKKFGE